MAEELPGFIPHILRADDVSLLRADETVFNAMVDGWRAQMLARVSVLIRSEAFSFDVTHRRAFLI